MKLNAIHVAAITPIQATDYFQEESRIDHFDEEQTTPDIPIVEMTAVIVSLLSFLSFFFLLWKCIVAKETWLSDRREWKPVVYLTYSIALQAYCELHGIMDGVQLSPGTNNLGGEWVVYTCVGTWSFSVALTAGTPGCEGFVLWASV